MKTRTSIFISPQISSQELALKEIFFYFSLVFLGFDHDFEQYSFLASSLWEPQTLFRWVGAKLLEPTQLIFLHHLWIIAGLSSAIGLFARFSKVCFFMLSFYLLGLERGFVYSNFQFHQLVIISFILQFTNRRESFCFDRFFKRVFLKRKVIPRYFQSSWVVELAVFSSVAMLFAAGTSKLRYSGWAWVTENQLYDYFLLTDHWLGEFAWFWQIQIKSVLLDHPSIIAFMGGLTLAAELLAPLFIFKRRLRPFAAVFYFGMFFGIYCFMFISEVKFLVPLIWFWIPLERIIARSFTFATSLFKRLNALGGQSNSC